MALLMSDVLRLLGQTTSYEKPYHKQSTVLTFRLMAVDSNTVTQDRNVVLEHVVGQGCLRWTSLELLTKMKECVS